MKINTTNILLGVLVIILMWQNFTSSNKNNDPQPITITLPEKYGTTGTQIIEQAVPYPVYLPSTNQNIQVDAEWKKKYEEAKDSLEKKELYLQSIKINKYEKTLVDNDTIQITGFATTRGNLLDYSVDYTIKPFNLSYTPEVVKERPKLSAGFEVEGGIPTIPNTNFLLKGKVYFENKSGNGFGLGYDTENRVWIGIKKTFTLIK